MEKERGAHCSGLAWRIACPGEPGGLQFTGSQRVVHELAAEHNSGLNHPQN